jgi:hypothetical protein
MRLQDCSRLIYADHVLLPYTTNGNQNLSPPTDLILAHTS